MESIKQALMRRDGVTEEEALEVISDARQDLNERLAGEEMPDSICAEWFGLEEDYVMELLC